MQCFLITISMSLFTNEIFFQNVQRILLTTEIKVRIKVSKIQQNFIK